MATAALPMYDLPELAWASDAWWEGLARALRREGLAEVPARLTRGAPPEKIWLAPDLLLAQTCGYPLVHALAGRVRYLATPAYDCPGCRGSDYHSLLIVRAGEPAGDLAALRGCRLVLNGWDSQSGMNALRTMVAPLAAGRAFFAEVSESGGHRASMELVAGGRADLAAIDCVSFALITEVQPELAAKLRVLGASPSYPGLPYITAGGADEETVARLRRGLFAAVAEPALAEARAALKLVGFALRPESDYQAIAEAEGAARALDYPRLV
jgi:ABC-type phosphate/phosphonate transport system substrate-binding protein